MQQYHELLSHILKTGRSTMDRTGVGTISTFGYQNRYDLSAGFPLVTTKAVHFKSVLIELLWFLTGSTNISFLKKHGVTIWDEWADKDGNLGPVYGEQWRFWTDPSKGIWVTTPDGAQTIHLKGGKQIKGDITFGTLDQISQLIEGLKTNPFGRRHIVSAWNPPEIPLMKLPPCHCLFQFYVQELTLDERIKIFCGGWDFDSARSEWKKLGISVAEGLDAHEIPKLRLSCQLYQRSADAFLGVPFNIASYAMLTMMVAQQVNMVPGEFIHTFGDLHIYNNHIEQVKTLLARDIRPLPELRIRKRQSLFDYTPADFALMNYNPHPAISAPVAV